jgi:hypothetical protein
MTKSSIISYLDFFILQKKKNPKCEKAISKWQVDREYVSGFKLDLKTHTLSKEYM